MSGRVSRNTWKMSVSTNAIQRAQLVPYYLDELADVYWNLAKFDAFSNQERTPAQRMLISEIIEQQKDIWWKYIYFGVKKFKTRYLWITWIESRGYVMSGGEDQTRTTNCSFTRVKTEMSKDSLRWLLSKGVFLLVLSLICRYLISRKVLGE